MSRFLDLCAAALLVTAFPVTALAGPGCKSNVTDLSAVHALGAWFSHGEARLLEFKGTVEVAWLKAYNSSPPVSHVVADEVLALMVDGSDQARVVFVDHHCVVGRDAMSIPAFSALVTLARQGQGSPS